MDKSELPMFVLLLVLIGMVLAIGALIFNNLDTIMTDPRSLTDEVTLVWNTPVALTGYKLSGTPYITFANGSSKMTNRSTYAPNATGFNNVSGTVTARNFSAIANVNITYTYDRDTGSDDIMRNMTVISKSIPVSWLPLVVTVAVMTLIVALVIRGFAYRR